jgi:hypothetical protein
MPQQASCRVNIAATGDITELIGHLGDTGCQLRLDAYQGAVHQTNGEFNQIVTFSFTLSYRTGEKLAGKSRHMTIGRSHERLSYLKL